MPSLKDKIKEDLKNSMKAGDAKRTGVLRMLISVLNNRSIEKKGKGQSEELSDEETLQVLMTEAKKRKESIDIFTKGGRADLAEKEKGELEVVQQYLPKQMDREEVEKIVTEIVKRFEKATTTGGVPPEGGKIGPVMKEVMKELRGKADSALISEIVKQKIAK